MLIFINKPSKIFVPNLQTFRRGETASDYALRSKNNQIRNILFSRYAYILLLPRDLLLQIFGWLDPYSIANVMFTCKKFYIFANEPSLWKFFCERDHIILPNKLGTSFLQKLMKNKITQNNITFPSKFLVSTLFPKRNVPFVHNSKK